MNRIAPTVLAIALAGCASSDPAWAPVPQATRQAPPTRQAQVPPTTPPPPVVGFRTAKTMNAPGLQGVIGVRAETLTRKFGKAQLDIWEGDVRKLQFTGEPCVLDVYLYPPQPGAAPLATHIEARRASDGAAVDRAACVRALSSK